MDVDQRKDEWVTSYDNDNYFEQQFNVPNRNAVYFCNWLEELKIIWPEYNQKVFDITAGKGANMDYMSKCFSKSIFSGIDIDKEFTDEMEGEFLDLLLKYGYL